MDDDNLSGTLRYRGGHQLSSEEIFHRVLAQIKPDTYELKHLSVFESPLRAKLEYVKQGSKSPQVLSLELRKNQKAIKYHISLAKPFWPWTKNDFDTYAIKALNRLKVI